MIRRALALTLAASLVAPLAPRVAFAQAAPSDAARDEARDRFERGKRLFNEGNNDGALAEFKRAYELIPNPVVLYNIGLVYALVAHPVEATDALDKVLASPGTLSADRIENAKRVRDEQAARIAEITVEVNVEGASIAIDNVDIGKAPLARAVRVASGTRVVSAVAPGYAPLRKEVTVAGGAKQTAAFELVAMQGKLAHLVVKTHLPGAEAFIDDQRAGTTPLAASVSLAPGAHRVELRRVGYTTASTQVTLGDGATGEVTLEPTEDPSALGAESGSLALDVSETQPAITIDGRSRGVYAAPILLARGVHRLLVERGDFESVERDVTIDAGRTTTLRIALEPTPAYRAHYTSQASAQRTWGWIGVIGGAVVAGGAVGLLVYDAGQRSDANGTISHIDAQSVRFSKLACDPGNGTPPGYNENCVIPRANAVTSLNAANSRDVFGYIGLGVGAAALGVGVVLLVTGNDPAKYDRKPDAASARPVQFAPTFWTSPGGGGVGVRGVF